MAEICQRQNVHGRGSVMTASFLPPLAIAVLAPGSFVAALGYAAVALVILAAFLPVAMVLKIRKGRNRQLSPTLALVTLGGIAIVGAQVGIASGFLQGIA